MITPRPRVPPISLGNNALPLIGFTPRTLSLRCPKKHYFDFKHGACTTTYRREEAPEVTPRDLAQLSARFTPKAPPSRITHEERRENKQAQRRVPPLHQPPRWMKHDRE